VATDCSDPRGRGSIAARGGFQAGGAALAAAAPIAHTRASDDPPPAPLMPALHDLTAAELSIAYARRDLSPLEVAEAVLARIDACEPRVNAMYRVSRERALAAARESERRWRAGAPASPIDGVPITLKENLYTQGDPAPIGTAAGDTAPKPEDSPVAARVREAGCTLVGKTTMPDLGMLSSGVSSIHGTTRNPWRLDRNPAGSSSGAAAAAAAGYGPLHVGTDIGGSIRLPATHTHLFGLKPSLGRVPIDPPFTGRVAGPMTRTVRDAALLMEAITRPDARDHMSLPYQPLDYAARLDGLEPRGLRIGLLLDMGAGLPVDPQVRAAAESAARALGVAGAIVEPMASFMTPAMLDGVQAFLEARSQLDMAAMTPERRAKVLPFVVEWATWRAGGFSGRDVMAGYNQLMAMREAAVRAVGGFDFVLSPVSPVPPYGAELHAPNEDPHDALAHIAFTVAYNMSEQPAASIGWGWTGDGLPIGVQLVGQRFDDLGVMRLARAVELLRPAQPPWPAL
jgi:aspartyl-tRNA(Asn)/glutamyl-tRNA(Gln) amidotransferase subunit A